MKKYLCLSAADIHGNKIQYHKLKQKVIDDGIDFVFLCGDLLPKDGGSWHPDNKVRTIEMQRTFIEDFFIDYLTDLGKSTNVYAIFGNDDFKSNYKILKNARIQNVYFLDNEFLKLPTNDIDLYVAGYPYIGITPFLHKDWERWDLTVDDIPHKIYRSDGYITSGSSHVAYSCSTNQRTIENDLDKLAGLSDPRKTIYIFHEAPYNTALDMIAPDNKYIKDGHLHIGSVAIRNFINDKKPLLTMHGHIHETYQQSGDYKWISSSATSLTAANDFSSNTLSCVLFSIPSVDNIQRIEI